MNQNIISGCGNYIKSEVLYYSHISPLRKVNSLNIKEIEKLYEALKTIPKLSYEYQLTGNYFNKKIYKNKNSKRTKTADGRFTYWDPIIQI